MDTCAKPQGKPQGLNDGCKGKHKRAPPRSTGRTLTSLRSRALSTAASSALSKTLVGLWRKVGWVTAGEAEWCMSKPRCTVCASSFEIIAGRHTESRAANSHGGLAAREALEVAGVQWEWDMGTHRMRVRVPTSSVFLSKRTCLSGGGIRSGPTPSATARQTTGKLRHRAQTCDISNTVEEPPCAAASVHGVQLQQGGQKTEMEEAVCSLSEMGSGSGRPAWLYEMHVPCFASSDTRPQAIASAGQGRHTRTQPGGQHTGLYTHIRKATWTARLVAGTACSMDPTYSTPRRGLEHTCASVDDVRGRPGSLDLHNLQGMYVHNTHCICAHKHTVAHTTA
jgi:hypothetical protein